MTRSHNQLIDPATLMRIKQLDLRAKRVVEGFYNGIHRSPYHGFSVEFSQYRPYAAGDDLRNMDWKLYARSDRYHVKQFEDETSRRCYLVVDQSRSMEYASLGYTKADYARTLAATLSYFLTQQRDSVGVVTFGEDAFEFLPARYRPGHFRRLLAILEQRFDHRATSLSKPLEKIAATVQKRGLIILISDLLAPVDDLKKHLAHVLARGHEMMILRVLDPGERVLPMKEPGIVTDMESGQEFYVDPNQAQGPYEKALAEQQRFIQLACDSFGIPLTTLWTDEPLDRALFELLRLNAFRGSGRRAR